MIDSGRSTQAICPTVCEHALRHGEDTGICRLQSTRAGTVTGHVLDATS